jgi:hypothetical protein
MAIEKALYTAHATSTGGREGSSKSSDGALEVRLSTPKELGGPQISYSDAMRIVDEVDITAKRIGAISCVVVRKDGSLSGSNNDWYGFTHNILEFVPDWRADAGPVAVMGAGGGSRAVVYGLMERGAREIRLCNRTHARALTLAKEFGGPITVLPWEARHDAIDGVVAAGKDDGPFLLGDALRVHPPVDDHLKVAVVLVGPEMVVFHLFGFSLAIMEQHPVLGLPVPLVRRVRPPAGQIQAAIHRLEALVLRRNLFGLGIGRGELADFQVAEVALGLAAQVVVGHVHRWMALIVAADVVDGDELHDQVVVPGHVERAVPEEPVRAGEVFHEPGGAQDGGGDAQAADVLFDLPLFDGTPAVLTVEAVLALGAADGGGDHPLLRRADRLVRSPNRIARTQRPDRNQQPGDGF